MRPLFSYNSLLLVCLNLTLIFPQYLHGQKNKPQKCYGEATWKVEDSSTLAEAKRSCLNMARIAAMDSAFGTALNQGNRAYLHEQVQKSYFFWESYVKGDFITDVSTDWRYKVTQDAFPSLFIVCEAKILAQEIRKDKVELEAWVSAGPESRKPIHSFEDGSSFFTHFRSPSSGFLTVYLLDELGRAYRILPYPGSPIEKENAVQIKADQHYTIGSRQHLSFGYDSSQIAEYIIQKDTDREIEVNELLFIFSKEALETKPMLKQDDPQKPAWTDIKRLNKWLVKNRKDLHFHRVLMGIEKKILLD